MLMSFVCFLTFAALEAGAVSFIKPCKTDDSLCLVSQAQAALPYLAAGIPELNLEAGVPMRLNHVNLDQGELKFEANEVVIFGPEKLQFLSVEINKVKSLLTFEVDCPVRAIGKYKMSGKVATKPIQGEGDFEIKSAKVKISVKATMDFSTGADGKIYWHIVTCDFSYDVLERVYFKFENLFNGDQEKAKPVSEFINQNWQQFLSVGKPIIDGMILSAKESTIKFYQAVPADELLA